MFLSPSRAKPFWPKLSFLTRRTPRRPGVSLYEAIVAQARSEGFYRELGVPDTVHGRFEMIVLHVALVLGRLGLEGEAGQERGRAMLEAFVADMDDACRRLGIGDMGVPRHVKKAAAAVLERGNTYRAAMGGSAGDRGLAAVLASEIWQGAAESAPGAERLADYVRRTVASLERQDAAGLLAGNVEFPELPAA